MKITKIKDKKIGIKNNSFAYCGEKEISIDELVEDRFDYVINLKKENFSIFRGFKNKKDLVYLNRIINNLVDEEKEVLKWKNNKIIPEYFLIKSLSKKKTEVDDLINSILSSSENILESNKNIITEIRNIKKRTKQRNQIKKSLINQNLIVKKDNISIQLNNDFLQQYIIKMFFIDNLNQKVRYLEDTMKQLENEIKTIIHQIIDSVDFTKKENEIKRNLSINKNKSLICNRDNKLVNFTYKYLYSHILKIIGSSRNYNNKKYDSCQIEKEVMAKIRNNVNSKLLNIGKGNFYFYNNDEYLSSFSYQIVNCVDVLYMTISRSYNQAAFSIYSNISKDSSIREEDIIDMVSNTNPKLEIKDTNLEEHIKKIFGYDGIKTNYLTMEVLICLNYIRNNIGHYIKEADHQNLLTNGLPILKSLFTRDIQSYKNIIEQNFISNEVIQNYDKEILNEIIENIYCNEKNNFPYIPSFKRILKELVKIKPEIKEKRHVLFLMKEIYYYKFINENVDTKSTIQKMHKRNLEENKKPLFLFSEIIKDIVNIKEIAYKIQYERTRIIANKNEKNGDFLSINFDNFLALAFIDFVDKKYSFIYEENNNETRKFNFDEISIKQLDLPKDYNSLTFYALAKLLSPREVNMLKGELLKFNQYYSKIIDDSRIKYNNLEKFLSNIKYFKSNISTFVKICDLVLDCNCFIINNLKMSIDSNNDLEDEIVYKSSLVKELYSFSPLVFFENESVKKEIKEKIGIIEKKYIEPFDGFFKNEENLNDWLKLSQLKNEYRGYNDVKISYLLSDLYSQLFSWIFMIERDMEYYHLAKNSIAFVGNDKIIKEEIDKIKEIKKAKKIIEKSLINDLFFEKRFFGYENYRGYRNKIMHYDIAKNNGVTAKDIIVWYNKFYCEFFKYDRKLKNNVIPRLKTIFENYNMLLEIEILANDGSFDIKDIKSEINKFKITDDDGKCIVLSKEILSKEFINRVKKTIL